LNDRLNKTYIYYGAQGTEKKANQLAQDNNAEHYGKENKVERAVSKSMTVYKNESWDLVDAARSDEKVIERAPTETLPDEMKRMTIEERKKYVKQKSQERTEIQSEIQKLQIERKVYQQKQSVTPDDKSLDGSMIRSIKTQAKSKNLSW
jgi:hypothetical protein